MFEDVGFGIQIAGHVFVPLHMLFHKHQADGHVGTIGKILELEIRQF